MATATSNSLKHVEWMWQSNPDSQSNKEIQWNHYSDVENLIIEEAHSTNEPTALLDEYYIDFKHHVQVSLEDNNKQRPIKRVEREREDRYLRVARFMDLPTANGWSFGGQYGWVSPFIIEVRRALRLEDNELPSKKPQLIPILVEKAAAGIIDEGKLIGKKQEAKQLAKMLLAKKDQGIEEVWKCCAYLYSLVSFLYENMNAAMRLVGDKEHEKVWESKLHTFGPFCLLLWDDPFNTKVTIEKTLYRGANLTEEQIANYRRMAEEKQYGSFQAFSSCSRNRAVAEAFGNTLFIMDVLYAFIADISPLSRYTEEEEELIAPGVCFSVKSVKYNPEEKKHLIHLELQQRFDSEYPLYLRHCLFRS